MKNLNNDMKIVPGDLFKIKIDKDEFYFLCTTTNVDIYNNRHFIGYTSEETTCLFDVINVFSFVYKDETINIYYSCNSEFTKCTTKGWIGRNKKYEYIYKDSLNRSTRDITYVVRLPLRQLHNFYKIKDRCSYLIFKKSIKPEDDIFNAGSVYSYNNEYIIAMRKGIINDELYGFYLKIGKDTYSSGFKMKMEDIESNRSNNTIKAIGYIHPLWFRDIFDIYTEGGNPSLNIEELLVRY